MIIAGRPLFGCERVREGYVCFVDDNRVIREAIGYGLVTDGCRYANEGVMVSV